MEKKITYDVKSGDNLIEVAEKVCRLSNNMQVAVAFNFNYSGETIVRPQDTPEEIVQKAINNMKNSF